MKNAVKLVLGCVIVASLCACNGKPAEPAAHPGKVESKVSAAEAGASQELALAFLKGVQSGDKEKVYQAANLTKEMVETSREKLIQIRQQKLTDRQRLDCEHALKISGDVDFFLLKLRKILPGSCSLAVTKTVAEEEGGVKRLIHTVSVKYGDRKEALRDRSGKLVKEMNLRLQQIDYRTDAAEIREFSFGSDDFEKMANREFEVLSYF